jgi:two-component system cell cycle response regulator DivK
VTEPSAARSREDDPRRWPARRPEELRPPRRPPPPASRRAGVVLVADDSEDVRQLYGMYPSHVGFQIFTASDGEAAVNIAIQVNPDVIVMDLSMPTLDGIATTRRIKTHPRTRHIPVILLTGFAQRAIERGALEAGVDVFLTKPCLPEDLETYVRRQLER